MEAGMDVLHPGIECGPGGVGPGERHEGGGDQDDAAGTLGGEEPLDRSQQSAQGRLGARQSYLRKSNVPAGN